MREVEVNVRLGRDVHGGALLQIEDGPGWRSLDSDGGWGLAAVIRQLAAFLWVLGMNDWTEGCGMTFEIAPEGACSTC